MAGLTVYQEWIAAHQPLNPRGQCATMTERMAAAFPELRRVRGHYLCVDGRFTHWWLVAPDGAIVDPTREQFTDQHGDYEEFTGAEPTGKCLNCGDLVFHGGFFCDAACATATEEFMNRQRRRA
jgi:hypothetical protein